MDNAAIKRREVKLLSLNLDVENPRTQTEAVSESTRDIIAALIEHEDIYTLAKSIVAWGGLYPSDPPFIVEEEGERIVIEGNRRIASLMLLDNPDLAPEGQRKKFQLLKDQLPNVAAIEKVEVLQFPSRESAAPIILSRHGGDAVRRWKPVQQARFYRSMLVPGMTIKDLAERLKIPEADIIQNLRADTMMSVARVMPLEPEVAAVVRDPKGFNFSVLERLIETPVVQEFLGIKFDADADIVGTVPETEFKKGYSRILRDIVKGADNGGIDTRTVNKVSQIKAYIDGLGKDTPNKKLKGEFDSATLMGKDAKNANADRQAATSKPRVKFSQPSSLPARGFKLLTTSARIREVFTELKGLRVEKFENTCGVMLRVFFELLLTHYLYKSKSMAALISELQKKKSIKNPSEYHPSMTEMMKFVMDHQISEGIPAQARRTLNRMLDNPHHLMTFDDMNVYAHSVFHGPNERDLRRLWDALEPLMVKLMI